MNEPAHLASAPPERPDPSTLRSSHAIERALCGRSMYQPDLVTLVPAVTHRDLPANDLDRPIRSALPELARGAATFAKLGIATPRQALFYLPFRYDDFSDLRPLGELVEDEKQSARARS